MPRRSRAQIHRARQHLRKVALERQQSHSPRRQFLSDEQLTATMNSPMPLLVGLIALGVSVWTKDVDYVVAGGGIVAAWGILQFSVGFRDRVERGAAERIAIACDGTDDGELANELKRALLKEMEASGLRTAAAGTLLSTLPGAVWSLMGWS